MSSLFTPVPQPGCVEPVGKQSGVLIVSSNQDLRRNLGARLEPGQWNVLEAGSGAEALQITEIEEVSLILLDPGLPDLKVDDFRGIIESDFPDVTVIPINPHTGQPIVASPSPDSICFEMIRKIERGAPFRPSVATVAFESEETMPAVEGLPGFIGRAPVGAARV